MKTGYNTGTNKETDDAVFLAINDSGFVMGYSHVNINGPTQISVRLYTDEKRLRIYCSGFVDNQYQIGIAVYLYQLI